MKLRVTIYSVIVIVFTIIFMLNSCLIFSPVDNISEKNSTTNNESLVTESKENNSKERELKVVDETDDTTIQDSKTPDTPIETKTTIEEDLSDQIRVIKPLPGQTVKNPLIIEGEARGTWFFEATFPVKLLDANGNILVSHYAQTQEEWMTEDFTSFHAQIEFEKPITATGTLVLEKDNPSGLPE